ncbi:MAG: hypothetical protein K0R39_1436 [Symbiobacteriaceae bacterium]|jgi:hypothetical protein|nr:hypothetical protein [Symbiobacteriaceae bacterium]
MGLSDELKLKIAKALAEGKVATRDDVLETKENVLVVTPEFVTYANLRTTQSIDGLSSAEVTHLKSTPVVDQGIVILEAALKGEEGAEEFSRGETRRFGTFNFRSALAKFHLEWPENRNLVLPVEEEEIPMPSGETRRVLVVTVKQPTTRERSVRPKKSNPSTAPNTGTPATNSAAKTPESHKEI